MTLKRTLWIGGAGWIATIALAHAAFNLKLFTPAKPTAARQQSADNTLAGMKPLDDRPFRVGFLPVTCHLTCPVTDFINKNLVGESFFKPMRFNGWPEIKEMFLSNRLEATFLLAPLAMSLRESGAPIKIVYLGHRDGTALMVHKDSGIFSIEQLRGKTVAVPNRYSNQRLMLYRALKRRGLSFDDIKLAEMAPPEMPIALQTRSVDAISSGEPFMGQTELDGYGRALYQARDEWPGFISCVLAVREDVIRDRREAVQQLVDGIAASGKWVDDSLDHRMETAEAVSRKYYNQDPRLLRYVLSKPVDRVRYSNLLLVRKDFEEIEQLGLESGVLKGTSKFDDYADPSFVRDNTAIKRWMWEPGQ